MPQMQRHGAAAGRNQNKKLKTTEATKITEREFIHISKLGGLGDLGGFKFFYEPRIFTDETRIIRNNKIISNGF